MKNIKIKSYSFKKCNSLHKDQKAITSRPNNDFATLNNNILTEVDKIIKSPGLNISSKLDAKGNNIIKLRKQND
jgi:hypothetical protein